MSIIHHVEQGSAEWYQLRRGRPTASMFHKVITPTGKPSTQARGYMYRLVAERLLNESTDDYIGHVQWAERGRALEPDAAAQFAFTHDVELQRVGFITTNDGRIGCSPDGIVAGRHECVEIKSPAPWTHLQYLIEGPGADYKPQVQGQLMIGEFEAAWFYSYHPRCPPAEIITPRDDRYIQLLDRLLSDFLEQTEATVEQCRARGAYVVTEYPQTPMQRAFPEESGPDPLQIVLPE